MIYSHLSKGVLVSARCGLAAGHAVHIWACFAIAAAFGIADSFFWPASGSILPSLVAAEELPRASAVVAASVTAGLRYARGKRVIRSVLVLIAAATLACSGLFAVALPAFAHALGRGALLLGVLVAC
jgi:hypothetical protein